MGASWPQLLILVAVIVLLFGTKKLRTLGSDLGASIKGFKKSMSDDENKEKLENTAQESTQTAAQSSEATKDKKEL